jgi:hypothetical protein
MILEKIGNQIICASSLMDWSFPFLLPCRHALVPNLDLTNSTSSPPRPTSWPRALFRQEEIVSTVRKKKAKHSWLDQMAEKRRQTPLTKIDVSTGVEKESGG